MREVFLSFVRADLKTAEELADALRSRYLHDISVSLGPTDWGGAESADGTIERLISSADCVIALWSRQFAHAYHDRADPDFNRPEFRWLRRTESLSSRPSLMLGIIERVELSTCFQGVLATDLVGWAGEYDAQLERFLLSVMAMLVGKAPIQSGAAPEAQDLLLGREVPDDVQFTAYHPKQIVPGAWHSFLAYAHLPDSLADVQADSRRRLPGHDTDYDTGEGTATTFIRRGAEISVVPELMGCRFNPERQHFNWLRNWHCAQFELQVTPEATGSIEGKGVNGRIAFYVGPLLVGEAPFGAYVSRSGARLEPDPPAAAVMGGAYRRIFVSYAHEDLRIVDWLERAYAALGETYLRDVKTIRSGETWNSALLRMIEQADIFQLCWSLAASRSRFVDQEWRHALKQRREHPFIRPTYWELPMPEVPRELAHLQFSYQLVGRGSSYQ